MTPAALSSALETYVAALVKADQFAGTVLVASGDPNLSNRIQPDGTLCTDGDLCTTGDACQSGICTPTFSSIGPISNVPDWVGNRAIFFTTPT